MTFRLRPTHFYANPRYISDKTFWSPIRANTRSTHTTRGRDHPTLDVTSPASETTRTKSRRSVQKGRTSANCDNRFNDATIGPVVAVFRDPDHIPISEGSIALNPQNIEYIGSYNWVDALRPTIIVPGSPRIWRNSLPLPYSLPGKPVLQFFDENGYRMRVKALSPLVAAVDVVSELTGKPPFDWSSVDIVSDRGNLRLLLKWLQRGGTLLPPFRIDLELAGRRSLLLTRRDIKPSTWVANLWSYGHWFHMLSTEPASGCEVGAGSHHRIITYNYDGLRIVLRCEIDACLPSVEDSAVPLSCSSTITTWLPSSPIQIMHGGSIVSQSDLVELKSQSRQARWKSLVAQLYLSQTWTVFFGRHRKGMLSEIRAERLDCDIVQTRLRMDEKGYRKLGPLLKAIRDTAFGRGTKGAKFSLICADRRTLELRERRTNRSCLPDEILQRFEAAS